ncbi:MAG: hypothetical protein E6J25_06285 [Chloroflexi bacterium]|nr:MAG: hypothetical protein E6J25_06285 [Chloroflexota bacterium]
MVGLDGSDCNLALATADTLCRLQIVHPEPCSRFDGDESDHDHKSYSCEPTDLPEKLDTRYHRPEDGGERTVGPAVTEEEGQDDTGEEKQQAEAAPY